MLTIILSRDLSSSLLQY